MKKILRASVFTLFKHTNSSNIKIFKYRAYLVFRVWFPPLNRQYRGIGLDLIKTKTTVITLINGNRQTEK